MLRRNTNTLLVVKVQLTQQFKSDIDARLNMYHQKYLSDSKALQDKLNAKESESESTKQSNQILRQENEKLKEAFNAARARETLLQQKIDQLHGNEARMRSMISQLESKTKELYTANKNLMKTAMQNNTMVQNTQSVALGNAIQFPQAQIPLMANQTPGFIPRNATMQNTYAGAPTNNVIHVSQTPMPPPTPSMHRRAPSTRM